MSTEQAQQHYQQMSVQIGNLRQKISELEAEKYEHELVTKALESMEDERRCFRLIGGVLVQRTKKEVLPAVQLNLEQIGGLIERLQEELLNLEQAALDFRNQHGLDGAAAPNASQEAAKQEDKKTGLLA